MLKGAVQEELLLLHVLLLISVKQACLAGGLTVCYLYYLLGFLGLG